MEINTQLKIERLEAKIRQAEQKGNGASGVVRKWKREIRNLKKTLA